MPLDNIKPLAPEKRELAKRLLGYFSDENFSSSRAAMVLCQPTASVVAILSDLVRKGVVYRIEPGIFSMVDPEVKAPRLPHHKARILYGDKAPLPENPIVIGPITTIDQAVNWLKAFRISVRIEGAIYVLDERMRATEEMVIKSAESRRTYHDKYPGEKVRSLAGLATKIPIPPAELRMRKR